MNYLWINNISAMYLMLPIGKRFCIEQKIPISIFVMPLAFCALIGGMLTAMGTQPNMIILERRKQELGIAAGIFYDTPLALLVAVTSITTIHLLARRMFSSSV